jgi:hypothetical protein
MAKILSDATLVETKKKKDESESESEASDCHINTTNKKL